MSKFFGVSIADPAKTGLSYNKIENDHFTVTIKTPNKPLPAFTSEQSKLIKFNRMMPSRIPPYLTYKVSTIPVSNAENDSLINLRNIRRDNLLANVEKAQLETAKYLRDTAVNNGAWFDPKSINQPTFKQTDRPVLRFICDPSKRLTDPNKLAKKFNYIYESDNKNYQKNYYVNNSWRDAKTGRVHLFEKPYTRFFA